MGATFNRLRINKHWLFRFILFVLFAALIVPSQLVYADPPATIASKFTAEEAARSYLYYGALSKCFKERTLSGGLHSNLIRESDAKAGKWLLGGAGIFENPTIGYFLTGSGSSVAVDDDAVACSSPEWILDAINLWGYTDPIQALCDFGAKRRDGSAECVNRTGVDFTGNDEDTYSWGVGSTALYRGIKFTTFQDAVKNKVYGSQDPKLTPEATYILQLNAFNAGCLGSSSPSVYLGSATDEFLYKISQVDNSTGEITKDVKFYGKLAKNDSIKYMTSTSTLSNIPMKCGDLAESLEKYVDDYSQYVIGVVSSGGVVHSGGSTGAVSGGDTTTCTLDGVGWIVCPVMNFLGDIADGSFDVITHLLSIRSELVASGDSSGTYVAWQYFRDISNVLFVIAFLVIIFSQLTGAGVNNYGVKKILPRLVITAILVNLSFYLCQIAVDISEILGHSLNSFIGETIPKQLSLPQSPPTWTENLGKVLAGVAISAAATGLAIAGYLAISVPVLLAALLSLVVTLAILVGRQAAVVILIVISPLAFVAYLLPNTEQWFKKWGNMLVGLLLVYPAISLLYGAGKLAGLIIHSANPGDVLMNIVALGATAIPLIATPSILKGSMNATGTIGAKLSGWASKANNAVGARVKDSSSLGEIGNYRAQQRQIRRAEGRAKTTGVRGVLNRVPNALGGMGYADHMARRGSALADQEFEQSVSDSMAAQKTMITEGKDDVDGLMQVATGKSLTGAVYSEADRVAAIRTIMKTGSLGQREKIYATSSESGVSNAAKAAMREGYFARGDHQAFGADLGDQFTLGKVDASALEAGLSEQLTKGKISAVTLASDKDVAERVRDIVNGLDDTTKAKVAAQASIAMSSPGTSEKLTSAHRDILSEISGNGRKGGLVDQHGNPL